MGVLLKPCLRENFSVNIIKMTRTSILLHGRTHYEEKHDKKGCQLMLDTIDKLDKETTELQSFTRIVNRTKD